MLFPTLGILETNAIQITLRSCLLEYVESYSRVQTPYCVYTECTNKQPGPKMYAKPEAKIGGKPNPPL